MNETQFALTVKLTRFERILRDRLIMGAVMAEAAFVEDEFADRLGRGGEGGVALRARRRDRSPPGGGGRG